MHASTCLSCNWTKLGRIFASKRFVSSVSKQVKIDEQLENLIELSRDEELI